MMRIFHGILIMYNQKGNISVGMLQIYHYLLEKRGQFRRNLSSQTLLRLAALLGSFCHTEVPIYPLIQFTMGVQSTTFVNGFLFFRIIRGGGEIPTYSINRRGKIQPYKYSPVSQGCYKNFGGERKNGREGRVHQSDYKKL